MNRSRNRKRRKAFIIAGILLIIIAGAVFFGYQLLFNNIEQEEKASIDDEVNKITQSIIDEIQNRDTQSSQSPQTADSETGEPVKPAEQEDGQQAEIARVIDSYEKGFEKLRSEGNAIVDRLVREIKAEYSALTSGGSKVDLGKLAISYASKANAYESSLDSSVTMLLSKMGEDLKSAGMPVEEVKTYIKRLESEYEDIKEKRQDTMLDKAKEYL